MWADKGYVHNFLGYQICLYIEPHVMGQSSGVTGVLVTMDKGQSYLVEALAEKCFSCR